ncbi:MAG: hypothetical protein R3F54_17140 [Alphaproteobacteria bacterium]
MDLEIQPAADTETGEPAWVIYDPLQRRYFQIDQRTKELIHLWNTVCSVDMLANRAEERLGISIGNDQIADLVAFLQSANLLESDTSGNKYATRARRKADGVFLPSKLIKNSLFFKVPLISSDRFLRVLAPYVEPLYSWKSVAFVATIGLLGLYLVSRQWAVFWATFSETFSFEAVAGIAASLLLLKIVHEFGHALTAVRFGCHVPSMGVAVMLFAPVLYTDVSDTWRLSSRRKRMLVSGAGVAVEIAIACVATCLWAFLPDGTARGIVFILATSAWITSLAFNLNPFMKFDGYYLLSDFLKVDNLQQRAFALGRWRMREILFAPGLEPPEFFAPRLRRGLIAFAWATWVYRLILGMTIALIVYSFAFKLLGMAMSAFVLWFLLVKPAIKEVGSWKALLGPKLPRLRLSVMTGLALALLSFLCVPWFSRIEIPALLQVADLTHVYPPESAEIISVDARRGEFVQKSTAILHLHSPELDMELAATKIQADIVKLRLARITVDSVDRSEARVLARELDSLLVKHEGLLERREALVVRAPITGTLVELDPELHEGRWITRDHRLASMSALETSVVKGYVSASGLDRLPPDAEGAFIPDDLTRRPIPVKLIEVVDVGSLTIDIPELASIYGGKVLARVDQGQRPAPVNAQYLVTLEPHGQHREPWQAVRGVVNLEGASVSLIGLAWNRIAAILVRESGF